MKKWLEVCQFINQQLGTQDTLLSAQPTNSGNISQSYLLEIGSRKWFVKSHSIDHLFMFEAEKNGLDALNAAKHFRVPKALGCGQTDTFSFIALEYIPFTGKPNPVLAGRALAHMHSITDKQFGWWRNNTIGSTLQVNTYSDSWLTFFRENRIASQLSIAAKLGYGGRLQQIGEKLLCDMEKLLNHQPSPSLLHGDLWSGNLSYDDNGMPAIYDPATYFGDRETDLAMTELFGGFNRSFYDAYKEVSPLATEYSVRKKLYNVYHIINHLNLFGGSYHTQAITTMESLLAEIN